MVLIAFKSQLVSAVHLLLTELFSKGLKGFLGNSSEQTASQDSFHFTYIHYFVLVYRTQILQMTLKSVVATWEKVKISKRY